MAYIPDATDPFAGGEKIPSLSWNQLPIGSTFTLTILDAARLLQSAEFGTGSLKFWDPERTRPVMCAVLNVRVESGPHSVGEERSIWAQIPSNLFITLKHAQSEAEMKFQAGGTLHLRFIGELPHETKGFHPIKQYQAKYIPPATPLGTPDPFANGQTPQPVQQPSVAQPAVRPTTAPAPKW